MSSGATSVLAPPKPWEQSAAAANSLPLSPVSSGLTPPLPPAPPALPQASYNSNGYSSNPGFSSFNSYPSYPSYSQYSAPYYHNNNSFPYFSGNGHYPYSASQNHPLQAYSLESTTRPLLDSLNHIIQAINHVACFLDSTVFSVWTAVSAITGLVSALKGVKGRGWLLWLREKLKQIKAVAGRKRILLLSGVLAVLACSLLVKREGEEPKNTNNTSAQDSIIETRQITTAEDEFAFVRANYAFEPATTTTASQQLSFKAGDVILVAKSDIAAVEGESKWIVGRMKDGRSGFFPSNYARIKKIMQLDHEIGKVALATPILISKALEIFMQNLVDTAAERARQAQSTKLEAIFLKNSIFETEQFDFLKDIVAGVEEKPAKVVSEESPRKTAHGSDSPDDNHAPSSTKAKRAKKNPPEISSGGDKEFKFVVYSAGESEPVPESSVESSASIGITSKTAISSMLNEESITPTLDSIESPQ